jgi:hypothetical protein
MNVSVPYRGVPAAAPHPNPLPVRAEKRDGERGRVAFLVSVCHCPAGSWPSDSGSARTGREDEAGSAGPLSPFVFTNGERVGVRGGRGQVKRSRAPSV